MRLENDATRCGSSSSVTHGERDGCDFAPVSTRFWLNWPARSPGGSLAWGGSACRLSPRDEDSALFCVCVHVRALAISSSGPPFRELRGASPYDSRFPGARLLPPSARQRLRPFGLPSRHDDLLRGSC